MTTENTAAIFARVSTLDQAVGNQLPELRELAAHRGMDVAAEITVSDSAWSTGKGSTGTAFDTKRAELLAGARAGKYQTVLLWSLDRLSRRGAEDMLAYVRQLSTAGVKLVSVKDPWVESLSDPMTRELLLGIFATLARFESERRSERIRAGLARRKAEGLPIGGAPGRKDRKPRKRSGYYASWEARREEEV